MTDYKEKVINEERSKRNTIPFGNNYFPSHLITLKAITSSKIYNTETEGKLIFITAFLKSSSLQKINYF